MATPQIDLPKQSVEQLKSLAYDTLVNIEKEQKLLSEIAKELEIRNAIN